MKPLISGRQVSCNHFPGCRQFRGNPDLLHFRSRMPRIPKATTMPPASKIAGWSPSNGQMAIALSRTAGARRSRQPAIAAFPT